MLQLLDNVGRPLMQAGPNKMLGVLENIRIAVRDVMPDHYSFSSAVVSLGQATDYVGTCVNNPTVYDILTLDAFLAPTASNASTSYADRLESEMGFVLCMQSRLSGYVSRLKLLDKLIPKESDDIQVQLVREALDRVRNKAVSLYNHAGRLIKPLMTKV